MELLVTSEPDQPLTLGQFRAMTKDMPDDAVIGPRFVDPPSDHEPGVRLLGFGTDDSFDGRPVVALAVELFYLDEIESEPEPDEDG